MYTAVARSVLSLQPLEPMNMYVTNSSSSLPSEAEVHNASGFNQVLNNLKSSLPVAYVYSRNAHQLDCEHSQLFL